MTGAGRAPAFAGSNLRRKRLTVLADDRTVDHLEVRLVLVLRVRALCSAGEEAEIARTVRHLESWIARLAGGAALDTRFRPPWS